MVTKKVAPGGFDGKAAAEGDWVGIIGAWRINHAERYI